MTTPQPTSFVVGVTNCFNKHAVSTLSKIHDPLHCNYGSSAAIGLSPIIYIDISKVPVTCADNAGSLPFDFRDDSRSGDTGAKVPLREDLRSLTFLNHPSYHDPGRLCIVQLGRNLAIISIVNR